MALPPEVDPSTGEASDDLPLNPEAEFTQVYDKQLLKIQTRCNNPTYADLDKGEVGVGSDVGDIRVSRYCSSGSVPVFGFDTPVALVTDGTLATLTAKDCVEQIRTGPLAAGADVPIKQGGVLCITTSAQRAVTEGISRKVVALEVVGIVDERETATATVRVNAWDIPR